MELKIFRLVQLSDEELIKQVHERLMPRQPDFSDTDKPVIYLVAATGIIENGGLRYFYENDFPDGVSHAEIAGCYRNIDMEKVAQLIEKSVAYFPSGHPQPDLDIRNNFLDAASLNEALDGIDADLFSETAHFEKKMAAYIRKNIAYFSMILKI